ncbi:MAG: cysteine desulfurase family protein [Oscillospiraceae bacterium]
MEHYLDNSATTRVCPEAAEAALKAMTENYGNPSSTHTKGREAKRLLDESRKQVAAALGCTPQELVFTSCGSESDNWAILNGAELMHRRGKHVISSMVEHDAVLKSLDELERRGYEVTRLRPDKTGAIPVQSVLEALRPDTVLVSLMLVNNETGAVTDIAAIARAIKKAAPQVLLHTDGVQAFMKLPFTAKSLGADMISISGHKIHAPKGIGALYITHGLKLKPFIVGGISGVGPPGGHRGHAADSRLRRRLRRGIGAGSRRILSAWPRSAAASEPLQREIPELVVIGGGAPHILSISLPGWRSEVLMNFLEEREIYVSKSSACKKGGRSHVLEAMGLEPRVIDGAIRIGLSRFSTREDIYALRDGLREARERLAHV